MFPMEFQFVGVESVCTSCHLYSRIDFPPSFTLQLTYIMQTKCNAISNFDGNWIFAQHWLENAYAPPIPCCIQQEKWLTLIHTASKFMWNLVLLGKMRFCGFECGLTLSLHTRWFQVLIAVDKNDANWIVYSLFNYPT